MKKIFVYAALASLALSACHTKSWYEKDGIPVEPEPEPVITYEGEGSLINWGKDDELHETNSTYAWKADETTITIEAWVDGSQYVNGDDTFPGGQFCIGWFTLDRYSINDFLGVDVRTDLDESNFYGVEPDGTPVGEMTSYKPGMWVAADGTSCGWGDGRAYWQWYIWGDEDGDGYDMDANEFPDIIYLGSNPGNVKDVLGKDVTSRAQIEVAGVVYDWIVTIHFGMAEKMETGEGNLIYPVLDENWENIEEEVATTSKYSWTVHETEGISINLEINSEEWSETGDWTIGFIPDLTPELVESVLGFDPAVLDNESFYPLEPNGDKTAWTSYEPGQWIDNSGAATDYASGVAYWQWYIREDQYYDYGYENLPGVFMIGGNPGNLSKIEFDKEFTSSAVMVYGDNEYPVTVTYVFHDVILPETEGYPSGNADGMGGYRYGGGSDGPHQLLWYFDEEGLTVDVDIYVPAVDGWGITAVEIPIDVMTGYLGIDDPEQLMDITYFYPLNPDGSAAGDDWTSYKPGQWVDADGVASGSGGMMYWQYQFGAHTYDGHFTDGLLVIGTNPNNVTGGVTVTSKAQLGDKLMTVNVNFLEEYPVAKTGKVGPHSYSWTVSAAEGVNIVVEASASLLDGSWAWLGFPMNEVYINEALGVDVDALTEDFENGFYPVAPDGATKLENWTSYIPGMWFDKEGNAGGYAFWQWYTVQEHDFEGFYNMFYVGKNPNNAYTVGDEVTSKAVLGGYPFNFTLKVVE